MVSIAVVREAHRGVGFGVECALRWFVESAHLFLFQLVLFNALGPKRWCILSVAVLFCGCGVAYSCVLSVGLRLVGLLGCVVVGGFVVVGVLWLAHAFFR